MKKTLKNLLVVSATCFVSVTENFAQLGIPQVEDVYGGRINAIAAIKTASDSSRIFISTESANSIFYADAYVPLSGTPVVSNFQVMPGADDVAGYGSNVMTIAAHDISGKLFFIGNTNLLSTSTSSTAVSTVQSNINTFTIVGSTLLFTAANQFKWGSLDAMGALTLASGSPITNPVTGMGMTKIYVNKNDSLVYLFQEGTSPKLYVSSDKYTALSSSSTFSDVSPTTLNSTYQWKAFGIAPDGRFFIGGNSFNSKYIAYSDSLPVWTEVATGVMGVAGSNIDFAGNSTSYTVYFGSAYSNANGIISWNNFGVPGGFETHPNDGPVLTDPTNDSIVYMTTDQGIGASHTRGENIYEIDNGVEAVQVKDIDMTADKNTAWIASKSGIRQVTNYQSTPMWTNAIFPNMDGSPYYSVAMKTTDDSTVFVGNARVYKTTDAGNTWTQVFTAENPPYSFSSVGVYVKSLEYFEAGSGIVFAGYYAEGPAKGGVFYSMNGGSTWNQLLVEASSNGQDVDVRDIVFNIEGTDTVAYIGVAYDLSSIQGKSVYRAVKNGSSWTVSQNFDGANTSVGYQIVATINDLHISVTGDTVYACGTDAGVNEPHVYAKAINGTNKWVPLSVNGFPYLTGTEGKAFTIGNDTAYCAVDNEIYYMPLSDSTWTLGYSYPVGNEINFLYFDELLVGAGTGLYGQSIDISAGIKPNKNIKNENNISIFPNPTKNNATISYTLLNESNVEIAVYDIMGKRVSTVLNSVKSKGTHNTSISVDQLPKGAYIIKMLAGSVVSTKELIVE